MLYTKSIQEKDFKKDTYWADIVADILIKENPGKNKFVCAAGISPSGAIHFGNFRDVVTSFAIVKALQAKGKKAELIFSWDNFDRLRKVPPNLEGEFEKYIGMPLSDIPYKDTTYAEFYQNFFEDELKELNIKAKFIRQNEMYLSGKYDDQIIHALKKRKEIADIFLSYMTKKGKEIKGIEDERFRETYYPISVYSSFTNKDATEILDYDGDSVIKYKCKITGKEEEIDIREKHIVKLSWKVDWAMRWGFENVLFEPGGQDHSSKGGSYEVSSHIAKEIFNTTPPHFLGYGFVGIQGLGTKMSGSKGEKIIIKDLLSIYEPALLLWMYLKRLPSQTFSLSFGTEVYRQYDEMDKSFILKESHEKQIIETILSLNNKWKYINPISFRQIIGYGESTVWNEEKIKEILELIEEGFDKESVSIRLKKGKVWLTKYNKDKITQILVIKNEEYYKTINEKNKEYISKLKEYIQAKGNKNLKELESFIYSLPKKDCANEKELRKAQKELFKNIYSLLISKDTGPRLSTLLWSLEKKNVLNLL